MELKRGIEILVGKLISSYGLKQSKYCFDQTQEEPIGLFKF